MLWLLILSLGMVAGTVGGVVGFGGSTILLPALVLAFGAKAAVPIMGIAALLANLSRVAAWWRLVDWRAAAIYSLTGVPAVALGARTFLQLDARLVEAVLGVVMILMVPARRWFLSRNFKIGFGGLALAGAGIGFLTGMVASTGPINTPFFLAYGLGKGAFIATEALGSLSVYVTKTLVFQRFGALPWDLVLKGVVVGVAMMAGSWVAKSILQRLSLQQFQVVMDALMLASGLIMIWGALAAASLP